MRSLSAWFSQIDASRGFPALFDLMPDLMFFVKDHRARIVTGNREFAQHCGLRDAAELLGRTDEELFPPYMARKFQADDAVVLRTGEPLRNLVELFPTRERLPEWFITQKQPLWGHDGTIRGLCGVVQRYEPMLNATRDPVIALVKHIRTHYAQPLSIATLADSIGLSPRQLERRFQATFRTSPRQFIVRLRVLVASDQLRNSDAPVTEIAHACGFYDHSSFIRHFRKVFEVTPLAYRRQYRTKAPRPGSA